MRLSTIEYDFYRFSFHRTLKAHKPTDLSFWNPTCSSVLMPPKNMFLCSYVFKKHVLMSPFPQKNTCSYVLSPRFLPNLLKKPLFSTTSMRTKDSLSMASRGRYIDFCTCESFKSTLLKPFPRFYIC